MKEAIYLKKEQIDLLYQASAKDTSEIMYAILDYLTKYEVQEIERGQLLRRVNELETENQLLRSQINS